MFLIRSDGHGFEIRPKGTQKVHGCLCFCLTEELRGTFGLLCLCISGVGFGAMPHQRI